MYVTVMPGGANVSVEAFDDRTGLVLPGATALVEGGVSALLDASGRATLLGVPGWVKVEKEGHVPVWRTAQLQVAGVQALVDVRLTPMDAPKALSANTPQTFGGGALRLTSTQDLSALQATPLSTQGLPGLLPAGWSAVAAWWIEVPGTPALTATLTLPGNPTLADLAWVRWDSTAHAWTVLAKGLSASSLSSLALSSSGGYALVIGDPAPTEPPSPEVGQGLQATAASAWREDLKATGLVTPSLMPTVDAIRGARITARLDLAFEGKAPIPSGTVNQAELIESYALVNQSLIEPEVRTQDGMACRQVLGVDPEGKPTLVAVTEGLALELPIRMSRSFQENDLVEGRILSAFYHEGLQVATGGEVIASTGGSLSRDGIKATFPAGAFTQGTFVRIQADPNAEFNRLWPELEGKGTLLKSFQVQFSGSLAKGLGLTVTGLTVASDARPLLLQRREVQGQRPVLVVGALKVTAEGLVLDGPVGAPGILESGAFAVLVPTQSLDWATGQVTMPAAQASTFSKGSGRTKAAAAFHALRADSGDVAVKDALVQGDFLPGASDAAGTFAVVSTPGAAKRITGERWDLGIRGTVDSAVPATGLVLRLATTPFRILSVLPAENAEVESGSLLTVLTTAPVDPTSLGTAMLEKQDGTSWLPTVIRRELSQDGRTLLLIPETPMNPGSTYRLSLPALKGLNGEVALAVVRTFKVRTAPVVSEQVDTSRITLSYPDDNYNVTITIPEGALPAGASFVLEAPGMGSSHVGHMSPSGPLTLVLKAALGERLKLTVLFPSGKQVVAYLSRYVSGDGSGRVTVGVDGGRVEAVDGSGAAVTLPPGTLDGPVELIAKFTKEPAQELVPEYQTLPIAGRVQLFSTDTVSFRKVPLIELPDFPGALNSGASDGIGAYPVLFRNDGYEDDGTPARWYEFLDTADALDGKLRSRGGLPGMGNLEPSLGSTIQTAKQSINGLLGNFHNGLNQLSSNRLNTSSCDPVGLEARPIRNFWRSILGQFAAGTPIPSNSKMSFDVVLDGMVVANPGPIILQGTVYRKVEGDLRASLVQGARVFFSADGRISKASGRFLSRSNECGRYILMNALFSDFNTTASSRIVAVDPDFGVSDQKPIPAIPENTDPSTIPPRKFFIIDNLLLQIPKVKLADHNAPIATLEFLCADPSSTLGPEEFHQNALISACVTAVDKQDKQDLVIVLTVDGVNTPIHKSPSKGDVGTWRATLSGLSQGIHTVVLTVADKSQNITQINRTLRILDMGNDPAASTDPVTFRIEVEPIIEAARPETMIRVAFSHMMAGVTSASIVLEKQEGTTWRQVVGVRHIGIGTQPNNTKPIHTLFLIPEGRLETGCTYQVRAYSSVQSLNGVPLSHFTREFKVASIGAPLVDHKIATAIRKISSIGGRAYVATDDKLFQIDLNNATSVPMLFGVTGSGGNDFLGQVIDNISTFRQVPINGTPEDLLLVSTSPRPERAGQENCVLWGFNICRVGTPLLRFGVSIGPGGTGYAPTFDCRDGMILVGRMTASLILIDVGIAASNWNQDITATIGPMGNNVRAIVQPFWLVDPNYRWENGGASS